MHEYLTEIWRGIVGVVLMAVAGVGWWIKRQVSRLDAQDDRINALERDHVTRREMRGLQEHLEKTVKESETHIVNRIDNLYQRLSERK